MQDTPTCQLMQLFSEMASLYMRKHSVFTYHDNLEPAGDSDCPEENVEEMNKPSASVVGDVVVKKKSADGGGSG